MITTINTNPFLRAVEEYHRADAPLETIEEAELYDQCPFLKAAGDLFRSGSVVRISSFLKGDKQETIIYCEVGAPVFLGLGRRMFSEFSLTMKPGWTLKPEVTCQEISDSAYILTQPGWTHSRELLA